MRALVTILVALLAGCAPAPVVDVDLRALDGVPVVAIQTDTGTATALLLEDGSLLTCSHALPRGEATGPLCIMGLWTRYEVLASGDGLARDWGHWKDAVPDRMRDDWSHLRTAPAARAADLFEPVIPVAQSPRPPTPGETVYVVGYSIETAGPSDAQARLVRHWVPLVVIEPPTRSLAATAEPVAWLRTAGEDAAYLRIFAPARPTPQGGRPDAYLAPGFSGAPVLRRAGVGPGGWPAFEACGILVAADRAEDSPHGRFGLAIPLPPAKQP